MTSAPSDLSDPTAAILIIGDEILSGKVEEENARFLVAELRQLGVSVRRIDVRPDVEGDIVESVRTLSSRYDYVFTSGGVGPTHDDVTLPSIALAFGMHLERRPELEALIRRAYGDRLHDRDLRMADVPVGANLVYGDDAPAPAWPVLVVHNVYILPGVPSIFRRKFALLRSLLRAGPIHGRAVYSSEGEGPIAAALEAVVAAFPMVKIGSYPQLDAGDHKVKITLDSRDLDAVDRAMAQLVERLGPVVVRSE